MSIRRVMPDIKSRNPAGSRAFYVDFLGFELAMDMGFVMTFVSPSNPTTQISVMRDDGGSMLPDASHGASVASSSSIRMEQFSTS